MLFHEVFPAFLKGRVIKRESDSDYYKRIDGDDASFQIMNIWLAKPYVDACTWFHADIVADDWIVVDESKGYARFFKSQWR